MPTDARLTRREDIQLYELIESKHFDVHDFSLTHITQNESNPAIRFRAQPHEFLCSKCIHLSSESYFIFGYYGASWTPGTDRRVEHAVKQLGWPNIGPYVHRWLDALRYLLDNPSPWESLRTSQSLTTFLQSSQQDSLFTPQEQEIVTNAVNEAKQVAVNTPDLPPDHLKRIADSLDTINESSANVSKRQFVNLALAEMVKLLISKVDEPTIHSVFNTLMHGVQVLYGHFIRLLTP